MDTRNFPILAHNSAFHKLGNACALAIETLWILMNPNAKIPGQLSFRDTSGTRAVIPGLSRPFRDGLIFFLDALST